MAFPPSIFSTMPGPQSYFHGPQLHITFSNRRFQPRFLPDHAHQWVAGDMEQNQEFAWRPLSHPLPQTPHPLIPTPLKRAGPVWEVRDCASDCHGVRVRVRVSVTMVFGTWGALWWCWGISDSVVVPGYPPWEGPWRPGLGFKKTRPHKTLNWEYALKHRGPRHGCEEEVQSGLKTDMSEQDFKLRPRQVCDPIWRYFGEFHTTTCQIPEPALGI